MGRKYIVKVLCPTCWGTGHTYRNGHKVVCGTCEGAGEVERTINEVESEGIDEQAKL